MIHGVGPGDFMILDIRPGLIDRNNGFFLGLKPIPTETKEGKFGDLSTKRFGEEEGDCMHIGKFTCPTLHRDTW